jgi:hypothetical protein
MIASPSDVTEEREIAAEVIHEWNSTNSRRYGVVLMPIRWETDAVPQMQPPQAAINKQLLEHCDLLIGVFWARLGTRTGTHPSGTVEEIDRHIETEKPAMLYFSLAPVPQKELGGEQFKALLEFKKQCRERSLYWEYDTPEDFRGKLRQHLAKTVNDDVYLQKQMKLLAPVGTASRPSVIAALEDEMAEGAGLVLDGGNAAGTRGGLFFLPRISDEAKTLLVNAAKSPDGMILVVRFIGGFQVQAGNFVKMAKDRKEEADLEASIKELESHRLVVDKTGMGEGYLLTEKGYHTAGVEMPER